MKRVLLLLSPGFEELEAITPLDLLRRAGIKVISAALDSNLTVTGSHGISVLAETTLEKALSESFDMVILPGGPGVEPLRKDPRVLQLVRHAHQNGILVAAICAAPLILADANILNDHVITSFPGIRPKLEGNIEAYSEARVVVDGNVITSRAAGTAEEFSFQLIETLLGAKVSEAIREQIVARQLPISSDPIPPRL